jgi:hypothetical protein
MKLTQCWGWRGWAELGEHNKHVVTKSNGVVLYDKQSNTYLALTVGADTPPPPPSASTPAPCTGTDTDADAGVATEVCVGAETDTRAGAGAAVCFCL